jgi:hypothetical protein
VGRSFYGGVRWLTRKLCCAAGMMDYGMGAMASMPGADPTGGFMGQLQDGNNYDIELATKTHNRNRGNYRCSKVRRKWRLRYGEAEAHGYCCVLCASVVSPRRATCVRSCRPTTNATAAASRRSPAPVSVRS